jgi:hypothetical protein
MNRSIVYVGISVIVLGLGFVAFPIVLTGHEVFDFEQEWGLFLAPVGLVVVLLGAVAHDPERTTVGGAFGNPDETPRRTGPAGPPPRPRISYSPLEPVNCRFCRTIITYDLANCPRCARARDCRSCGRPLGMVLDRATCPTCARPEVFCSCAVLPRPRTVPAAVRRRG